MTFYKKSGFFYEQTYPISRSFLFKKKKTQLPNDIYILDFLGCIMRLINLADFDR